MQMVPRVWPLLSVLIFTRSFAAEYHVATNGVAAAPGTQASPLNLSKVLSSTSPAKAGDTIWLHGGIYPGPFASSLTGRSAKPIILRQYPGERATINSSGTNAAALTINGAWTWYWGF